VDNVEGADRYVCIIPYQGKENDICGHWAADFELFSQHMANRHDGVLILEVEQQVAAPARAKHASAPEKPAVAAKE
jgi:hypothetical protein